jgi:hypothetical protein
LPATGGPWRRRREIPGAFVVDPNGCSGVQAAAKMLLVLERTAFAWNKTIL